MLLLILAIWYGYKKARDTGRNKFAWAAISGGVFIGIQLVVSLGAGILIGIGQTVWGWNVSVDGGLSIAVSLVALVLSLAGLMLVFRYLDRIPDEPANTVPPPPPTFTL
jgi:TRAP-type C4-dicarboxylate transport system permease small subunit